jgi:hypothetical protein
MTNVAIWVLTICTNGWVLCGDIVHREYPTEDACYRALDHLVRNHGHNVKYVTCAPKKEKENKNVD